MTSSPVQREPLAAQVAEHLEWVRRLAHGLVRDPEAADDLAHETLLAALRNRGEEPVSLRNWLASVLRRLAADRLRRQIRQGDRERRVARPERVPSTLDELARSSVQGAVVEEVEQLPDAYRQVLLWRYFDDLMPREIAERFGIPVATVKTRLQRGLAQLRDRLDARHGSDGRSWVAALAPLLLPERSAPSAAVLLAAAAGVVAALAGAAVLLRAASGGGAELALPAPPGLAAGPARSGDGAASAGAGENDPARAAGAPTRAPAVAERAARIETLTRLPELVRGRVLTTDGQPAAGVTVMFEPARAESSGAAVAISAADGGFELRSASGDGLVRAIAPGYATLSAARAAGGARDGLVVVVAPRRALSGVVVDAGGQPIAGAHVAIEAPPPAAGTPGVPWPVHARTEADGSFAIPAAPAVPGARLALRRSGFVARELELPARDRDDLRLALDPSPADRALEGRVLDPGGVPVPGARVALVRDEVLTDAAGRFRIDLPAAGAGPWTLRALVPGSTPAGATVTHGASGPLVDGDPGPATLVLGGAPRAIAGRVVDAAGRPLRGLLVWVADPTPFRLPDLPDGEGYERSNQHPDEILPAETAAFAEAVMAGEEREESWRAERTDAEGRFRLEGLDARPYRVAVLAPRTLGRVERAAVPAGAEDLEIEFAPGPVWPLVAGRILDESGAGVAGVDVHALATVLRVPQPDDRVVRSPAPPETAGERGSARLPELRSSVSGLHTTTGADGSFVLRDVPRADTSLAWKGPGVLPGGLDLAALAERDGDAALERLELAAPRLARLQVLDAGDADTFALVDGADEELLMHRVEGGRRRVVRRAALEAGRSAVLDVPRAGAELVLYREGEERRRVALTLAPGGLNVVRP